MSEEIEAAKAIATHPLSLGGLGLTVISWLANKVWRGYRHEIANMKQETANALMEIKGKADREEIASAWKAIEKRQEVEAKLFDMMREHEQRDDDRFSRTENSSRDRHDELMTVIGDLRADVGRMK